AISKAPNAAPDWPRGCCSTDTRAAASPASDATVEMNDRRLCCKDIRPSSVQWRPIAARSAQCPAAVSRYDMKLRFGMLLEVATAGGQPAWGHHGPGRRWVDPRAHVRGGRDS